MSVLTIAVACGHIVSFALSGFAYANIDLDTLDKEELKAEVLVSTKKLILAQNVPYLLVFIIFQIIIKDKPDIPPSAVAEAPPSEHSFLKSFKEMWQNKNFMLLAAAYALIYGTVVAISTTMSNCLNPFGY